jgi:uncharacterized protein
MLGRYWKGLSGWGGLKTLKKIGDYVNLPKRTVLAYIARYRRKATVVRQIHSDKAETKRGRDLVYTILTLVFGAITTFIGFTGPDRLFDILAISKSEASQRLIFDFVFNLAVLCLFITTLLNLVFRWKEEHTAHFQSVVYLTQYLNWLDELELMCTANVPQIQVLEIRSRYQGIVEKLPPNNRNDYILATQRLKKVVDMKEAQQIKNELAMKEEREICLAEIVLSSTVLMLVLDAIKCVSPELWLGGGAIRNHVWDTLSGRMTPHDDFDVVFFDSENLSQEFENNFEENFKKLLPSSIRISVKNQARMHLVTGEPERTSLVEAIKNWPETATSIAARLHPNGEVEFIAPYGFEDLLGLILRPTPYHAEHPSSFLQRQAAKNWLKTWPELKETKNVPAQGADTLRLS